MIKDYWIKEEQNIEEFKQLASTEELEINAFNNYVDVITNDQFLSTSTMRGVERREKMLNITPFADDTIDSRKFRIDARWNNHLPYTHRKLNQKLEELIGMDNYKILLDYDAKIVTAKINMAVIRMFEEVSSLLRKMCPCNMITEVDFLYNLYSTLSSRTYAELSGKTYQQLREELM